MIIDRHLKILVRLDFPEESIGFWIGTGVYIDKNGFEWRGSGEISADSLKTLESTFAGEYHSFPVYMAGTVPEISSLAFQDTQENQVIGSVFQVLAQHCDAYGQPLDEDPEVWWTGKIADVEFHESVRQTEGGDEILYEVGILVANRFARRRQTSGSVLSDVDQKARSKVLNPTGNDDRFCERVSLNGDRTINWPRL